jgi:hypothetical protein
VPEKISARSWAIGIFGMRLNFALADRRILAEFPLSPAEHVHRSEMHLRAARELRGLGIQEHERPDESY